ncbi:MAG: type II toxin-antitoxin system Phd/YefM family antitoxin [bacterium]
MIKTLPITKAREDLTLLVNRASKLLDEYIITVNGSPAAVLMSANEYESWKETNEILADSQLVKEIKLAEKQMKNGKGIPWEKVKKELKIKT